MDDLAKEAQVTRGSLSRIENGKQNPSLALMQRLIAATNGALSPEDFFQNSNGAAA